MPQPGDLIQREPYSHWENRQPKCPECGEIEGACICSSDADFWERGMDNPEEPEGQERGE